MSLRSWLCLLCLLCLAGAMTACGERDTRCADLPGAGRYCLQPSTTMKPFEVQQKVDLRFNGRRETLIVELEVDSAGLRLAGLTPFGQKLLQISFDNATRKATLIAGPPGAQFDPALLVALIQMALWPSAAVDAGLAAPLVLEEDAQRRVYLNQGRPLMIVTHQGAAPPYSSLQLAMPDAGIEIDVENLSQVESGQSGTPQ